MTTKERLHQLIEELPEGRLSAVERFLEAALADADDDPVAWALDHAPVEEPLPDEVEAIRAARASLKAGERLVPNDEAMRLLLEDDSD